jgi:hypothetical protein
MMHGQTNIKSDETLCDGGIFLDKLSDFQNLKYNYTPGGPQRFRKSVQCDEFLKTHFYGS